ncbi:MAG TPA: hypothetical protein VK993_10190, partial [Chthoniobacterales bacterium]|nr:hypothetical protein [Chthoniobacterales bacterium]
MKRRRMTMLLVAVVIYAGAVSFVPVLDKLVLFPSTRAIDSRGAVRKVVNYDGGELEMWTAASRAAQ